MKKISMKNNQNLTLDEGFNQFIRMCKIKNLSPRTTKTYEIHYAILTKFLDENILLSEINSTTIDDWIIYLKEDGKRKDITVNSYLRSIRVFFYYLMELDLIGNFTIHMLKVTKQIKATYTDAELKVLLNKPNIKECEFTEYKTWVFSNYLLSTGNRISSALNLCIKDIDFGNNLITISKTKNCIAQIIPMSKTLASIIQEYLTYRNGEPDDYVFCTNVGNKADIHTYQGLLQRYNRKRGVMKTSAHLYRHTFAKNWILNGGDIFRLQKYWGIVI